MDFDPQIYDNLNNDTLIPAKRLINIINCLKSDNRQFSTILDIGCGSGNITKLMSQKIDCQHIIGCDIDQKMIEYAINSNKSENIEYLVQDIQQNWTEFCPKLRSLEGKISIITSNFALTWIKDIEIAAQNISKLIADDGYIVLNIVYDGDIYDRLPLNQRSIAEQSLKYPSQEEMIGNWIKYLKIFGFTQLDAYYWEPKAIFKENEYFEQYLNIPINWYKSYAKNPQNINIELIKQIKELLIEDRCKRLDIKSIDGKDLIEVTNYIWQIVATKS